MISALTSKSRHARPADEPLVVEALLRTSLFQLLASICDTSRPKPRTQVSSYSPYTRLTPMRSFVRNKLRSNSESAAIPKLRNSQSSNRRNSGTPKLRIFRNFDSSETQKLRNFGTSATQKLRNFETSETSKLRNFRSFGSAETPKTRLRKFAFPEQFPFGSPKRGAFKKIFQKGRFF